MMSYESQSLVDGECDEGNVALGGENFVTPSTDGWVFGVRENSRWNLWSRIVDAWDQLSQSWGAGADEGIAVPSVSSTAQAPVQPPATEMAPNGANFDESTSPQRNIQQISHKDISRVPAPWEGAQPVPTLDVEALRDFLTDALNDELKHLHNSGDRLFVERLLKSVSAQKISFPPFPDAARQLDTTLRQGNPSMARVVELVERDPSLVGSVWRRARSSAFLMPPSSLGLAIARIGFDALWRIGMEICMYSGVFRVRGFQSLADEIRIHGVVTAEVASWLNNEQNGPIYLAGLLHDAGKLVLLRNVSTRESEGVPSSDLVQHLFRAYHSSFSVLLADSWNLGDTVAGMVGYHHAPDLAPEAIQRQTWILSVADVVTHTADHYRRGEDCGGLMRLLEMDRFAFNPARSVSKAQEIFARIDAEQAEQTGPSRIRRQA